MLPRDLTRDVKSRIKSIKGQLDGLLAMMDEDKDPEEILNQFKAVQQGLHNTHELLLDEVYRKTLAIKISETAEACPGNCGQENKIETIRKQFPRLSRDVLSGKIREISEIKQLVDRHNTKE